MDLRMWCEIGVACIIALIFIIYAINETARNNADCKRLQEEADRIFGKSK